MAGAVSIHLWVDGGVKAGAKDLAGDSLACKCTNEPVKLAINSQSALDHVSAAPDAGSLPVHRFRWSGWSLVTNWR